MPVNPRLHSLNFLTKLDALETILQLPAVLYKCPPFYTGRGMHQENSCAVPDLVQVAAGNVAGTSALGVWISQALHAPPLYL